MHLTDDELILHYYGELPPPADRTVNDHLSACAVCQASFTTLQRVLAAVNAAPLPEVADGFERTAWARLQPALANSRRDGMFGFLSSPGRLAWAAGVVLLLMTAFFAGRMSQRAPVPQLAGSAADASALRERVLLADLNTHLDRSQMMLIELVSAATAADFDLPAERVRAERLAADNRLYRQAAVANGNQSLAAVLDDLEQVLVDVAASPDILSAADLAGMRARIENTALLLKVRVLSSEVQKRQQQDIRLRAAQSS
jgi:hypothetical protein